LVHFFKHVRMCTDVVVRNMFGVTMSLTAIRICSCILNQGYIFTQWMLKTDFTVLPNGSLRYTVLKDEKYCYEKQVKGKKTFVPLDPQPERDNVVTLTRCSLLMKDYLPRNSQRHYVPLECHLKLSYVMRDLRLCLLLVVCATCGRSTYVTLFCVRRLSNLFLFIKLWLSCQHMLHHSVSVWQYRIKGIVKIFRNVDIYLFFHFVYSGKTKYLSKFLTIFFIYCFKSIIKRPKKKERMLKFQLITVIGVSKG
jgi:hypothetical protein